MTNAGIKVDLHVHSKFSDSPKTWFLEKVGSKECWTEPEDVYKRARQRGMELVTLTDHDTISGALEIAHHGPHVFISEEISARFPENGCVAHVLAFDITEAQHREIQYLRYNIYDLVDYLRAQDILYSLAHPLSAVNHRLTTENVEKMFLLFPNMELLNGPRDEYHYHTLLQLAQRLTPQKLDQWANKHSIEPVSWDPARHWTAGSDDHSGHAIARCYTIFQGEPTLEQLKNALTQGQIRVAGDFMTPESLGHTIYSGTIRYFTERSKYSKENEPFSAIRSTVVEGKPPDPSALSNGLVRTVLEAYMEVTKEGIKLPALPDIQQHGNTEAIHSQIYRFVGRMFHHASKRVSGNMVDQFTDLRFSEMMHELPILLELGYLSIPYLIGFRYFYNDRNTAERVVKGLNLLDLPPQEPRVAIFTDTIDSVNGVSLSLRRLADQLSEAGHFVKIIGLSGCQEDAIQSEQAGEKHIVRFEALKEFPLFAYSDMKLGVPPLLALLEYVVKNRVTLIQASTPGPMGIAALIISKLLGVRIVGNYHTQVPEYAERLTNDPTVGRIVRGFVRWFYDAMEYVIAATHATRDYLVELGIRSDRVKIVPRGVDVNLFSPAQRRDDLWPRYGLNGSTKLLYVGRISKEKNLDGLLEAFQAVQKEGAEVELAVVGDGPYRKELEQHYSRQQGVVFTGFLEGSQLAQAYASADIFVFPSTTDTFGNVVLEALASGLPAVVTDQGGPSEIVQHNRTGFIVPAGNTTGLVWAILQLVQDPSRRRSMSVAARKSAEAWGYHSAAEALWGVYTASAVAA
ncbi:MAG: glycosyltransferase [Bradymonadales bacterium]|nr:glycosyltransferase [Bradymonadales bacterium]